VFAVGRGSWLTDMDGLRHYRLDSRMGRDIASAAVALGLEHGVLLNAPRPDSLQFMPALTV